MLQETADVADRLRVGKVQEKQREKVGDEGIEREQWDYSACVGDIFIVEILCQYGLCCQ